MKKIYTSVLLMLLFSGSLLAQESNIGIGLKVGVNFANMTSSESDEDSKSVTSFQIGGYADIPLAPAFSIQPGLSLTGKGAKSEYSEKETDYSYEETYKTNIMYLEIPVNAVYKISDFYIGAGPYAAFAISGKEKSDYTENDGGDIDSGSESDKLKFGKDGDYKGGDFGLNILAGYQLQNGLNIGLNYGLGLSNLIPYDDVDYSIKNRVFSVVVGFSF